jgi:hypothetical protein
MYVCIYVYAYMSIYAYQHKGNLIVDKVCMHVCMYCMYYVSHTYM